MLTATECAKAPDSPNMGVEHTFVYEILKAKLIKYKPPFRKSEAIPMPIESSNPMKLCMDDVRN